jgi:deoxyribose-phosphate aldolase
MKYRYDQLAGIIDHSLLHPTLTDQQLEDGCRLAARLRVATVCVKPHAVRQAARWLEGTGVKTGTVVGFPHGSVPTEVKRFETEVACRQGATEIDMVVNVGKALSGDWAYVEEDVGAVCAQAHLHGALVKVIFENDFLPDDEIKIRLCQLCVRVEADFVKTSTGYGFVKQADGTYRCQGATDHDLELMRAHIPPGMGLKAAGGVRTLDGLIRVRDLGANRCGMTATAAVLAEYRTRETAESESAA